MWKLRLACLAYCLILTFLLLEPNPAAHLGLPFLLEIGGGIGVHFAAFAVLGILVAGSRLPLRRVLLVGVLFLYAVGVELLQFPRCSFRKLTNSYGWAGQERGFGVMEASWF